MLAIKLSSLVGEVKFSCRKNPNCKQNCQYWRRSSSCWVLQSTIIVLRASFHTHAYALPIHAHTRALRTVLSVVLSCAWWSLLTTPRKRLAAVRVHHTSLFPPFQSFYPLSPPVFPLSFFISNRNSTVQKRHFLSPLQAKACVKTFPFSYPGTKVWRVRDSAREIK